MIVVCADVEARAGGPREEIASLLRLAEEVVPTPAALTGWWGTMIRAYQEIRMPDEAERIFRRFEQLDAALPFSDATWATVHLARGDEDLAYESLEAAVETAEEIRAGGSDVDPGFYNLMMLLQNVWHDPVLEEPRFVELRDRLGLRR
jgi:pentatricopeptide repeat protein